MFSCSIEYDICVFSNCFLLIIFLYSTLLFVYYVESIIFFLSNPLLLIVYIFSNRLLLIVVNILRCFLFTTSKALFFLRHFRSGRFFFISSSLTCFCYCLFLIIVFDFLLYFSYFLRWRCYFMFIIIRYIP